MSEKATAGSQVPLFDDLPQPEPILEQPEQMEFRFNLVLVKGGYPTAGTVARQKENKVAEPGSNGGPVYNKRWVRREQLKMAASHLRSDPTPKSVMVWFRFYSPDDQSEEALDSFLEVFLLAERANLLEDFLDRIRKEHFALNAAKD